MTKDDHKPDVCAKWLKKIDAKRRVKAVCKPCWEIKYCPYGPLVEDFPLIPDNDDRSCRIFGHHCPVFYVAEPFTETKQLRNISRNISRPTQFRVLKRENQICRKCGCSVPDGNIHFDHIIPWSKGGSSDENNIQLLCSRCNRKKSDKFEEEHLVDSAFGHILEPLDHKIIDYLTCLLEFAHAFHANEGHYPTADDFASCLNKGKKERAEEQGANVVKDLVEFFSAKPPAELKEKVFRALRDRWGFADGTMYTLKSTAEYYGIDPEEMLSVELSLVNRLGWRVALNAASRRRWLAS